MLHVSLEDLLATYNRQMQDPTHAQDTEALLVYLRAHGCSVIDSIKALMHIQNIGLGAAKAQVHLSATWADMLAIHDQIHDQLEQAVHELSDANREDYQ